MNDNEYSPFNSDLPRVQIPVGADRAGLTIDGEFRTVRTLPREAQRAYIKYAKQGGTVTVRQCQKCGYLTDAKGASPYERGSYECGGCGGSTGSPGGQRSATSKFPKVHGSYVEPDEEQFVDVLSVVSDQNCPEDHGETVSSASKFRPEVNEEAAECGKCVPNHPSHLGKLQNAVGGRMETGEMLQIVAEAVKHERET